MQLKTMIKKSFINPGAYSIFINQMSKDGMRHRQIAEIFCAAPSFPSQVISGRANPKYDLVEKANVSLTKYFHENESYKRHLRKTVEVYQPQDVLEWVAEHEDLQLFLYELGWTASNFDKNVLSQVREKTIKFRTLFDLTRCIDEWDNSELGDFSLFGMTFHSNLVKREEDES